jgi:hypothetical protein
MGKLVFLESVKKMPVMDLPVRSTYVPLQKGGILISPGSNSQESQLKGLGSVTDLVGPNLYHCAGIQRASAVFPNAKKWGPLGAKEYKNEISWSDEISMSNWPYQNELPFVQLQGMPKVNEVVFFHPDSKSLIVADLCFHMLKTKGIGAWIILKMFGTYKKFAVSNFFLRAMTDKAAFEKSLKQVFEFDFDNVIVSHGENLMGDGKNKLRRALEMKGLHF